LIRPDDILAYARECLGTPFRHQGRLATVSLDCIGVVIHVAQRLGLPHVDHFGYGRNPSGILQAALDAQICLQAVAVAQAGDVLLMRFDADPQHVGICTGEGLIHSYSAIGQVVEHHLDDDWRARVVKIYRFVQP